MSPHTIGEVSSGSLLVQPDTASGDMDVQVSTEKTPNEIASEHIYKPLHVDEEEIRVLVLHPRTADDSILRCTLLHTALASSSSALALPEYEALSYVWGEPDFSVMISLNDEDYWITPHLASILSSLRLADRARMLWVDALCINQSDLGERSQQVTIMRKIYAGCQRGLAWVGPLSPYGLAKELFPGDLQRSIERTRHIQKQLVVAMELMDQIVHRDAQTLQSLQDWTRSRPRWSSEIPRWSEAEKKSRLRVDRAESVALSQLFSEARFWQRIWIVQELSCAPQVTLVCDEAELKWESVSAFLKDEPYFDAFHAVSVNHGFESETTSWFRLIFAKAKLIEDQRGRLSSARLTDGDPRNDSSKLIDVLARFRGMKSTDPRDAIYALLGLVTQDHGIEVDYTKSVPELYQDVTISLINISGNLDIICQNPFEDYRGPQALREDQDSESIPSIPSWTAEFNSAHSVSVLFAQRAIFNAGTQRCDTPPRICGRNKELLVVRGSTLDTVGPVFEEWRHAQSAAAIAKAYLGEDVLNEDSSRQYVPKFASGRHISHERETAVQAYWRTMIRDCTAPPRMRRLRKTEIAALGAVNKESLESSVPFLHTVSAAADENDDPAVAHQGHDESQSPLMPTVQQYIFGDSMFTVTQNGLFLLTRDRVRQGDFVVVLDGGKVPVVLRKTECKEDIGDSLGAYHFVCVAYVHGFMDGEATSAVAEGWLEKEDFLLA